jgi:hypothetical protein
MSTGKEKKMRADTAQHSNRRIAIIVGILFIACSVTCILSAVPTAGLLDGPDYLTSLAAHDGRVVLGALFEFMRAITCAGIAIALYPVVRHQNRALALGSVAGRLVEGVLVLVGTLCMLTLLGVSQDTVVGGSAAVSSSRAVGSALLAAREWIHGFVMLPPFLIGALMYYYLLYKARLVPRWLSVWGLAAVALALVQAVYAGFNQELGFSTVNTVLNIPIGVQEMVLAVWLIAKGFSTSAVTGFGPATVTDRTTEASNRVAAVGG